MPKPTSKTRLAYRAESRRKHVRPNGRVSKGTREASVALMRRLISSIRFDRIRLAATRQLQRDSPHRGERAVTATLPVPAPQKDAKGQFTRPTWGAFIWTPSLSFYIDRVAPTVLIENHKARVYFVIVNFTSNTLTDLSVIATIRPQFFPPGPADITEYQSLYSWHVPILRPGEMTEGVLTFVVPPASQRTTDEPPPNVLTLSLNQVQQPSQEEIDQASAAGHELFGNTTIQLASDSFRFDSGSRYRLAVTSVTIKSTASIINDTVLVAVSGSAYGEIPPDQNENLGDHGGSGVGRIHQIPVSLSGVGYFDSIADGSLDQFVLTYVVANQSDTTTQENLETALNWLSRIAAAVATVATGVAYAPLWAAVEALTEFFNSFTKPCNRVVAQGSESFTSDDLFDITFDEAQVREITPLLPPPEFITKRGGNEGPACGTSDYVIGRTIFRDRTARDFVNLGDQDPSSQDFVLLAFLKYGQTLTLDELVNLTPGNLVSGLDGARWEWRKEYGNGTINKGNFIAPLSPIPFSPSECAVVTLQMLVAGKERGRGFIVIRFK
jgi:hypothetical protein